MRGRWKKARNLPVDGIILASRIPVAPDAKAMARDQIAQAIAQAGSASARS